MDVEDSNRNTVVCFDFDGTLVDEGGRIHPSDVEILANERSVDLIPATGRPLHSVRRVFERHGLFAEGPIPFPLVLENGAAVYAGYEELISQSPCSPDLQEELLRIALASDGVSFLLHSADEVRTLRSNGLLEGFVRRFDLTARPWDPASDPAEGWERPLVKIVATAEDPEAVGRFEDETSGLPLERYYSLPNMLEVCPAGVSKGAGLAELLGRAGRSGRNEIVVAGDGENDLPLFDMADLSFAPAGSPDAIRERTDRVLDVGKEGLLRPILREVRPGGGENPPNP